MLLNVEPFREFEESLSGVEAAQGQIQLGNSGLVNQDVTPDALGLYNSMIASYRWTDNVCYDRHGLG